MTLPGQQGMYYADHTFLGWNTQADGTGTSYGENHWYGVTDNITLYAQWLPSGGGANYYTVSYDLNGASGMSPAPETVSAGSGITLPVQGSMYYADHTFLGWNTRADGTGTSYGENHWYSVTDNITLYAQWLPSGGGANYYTVNYNSNGASGMSPAPETVSAGSSITLPGQQGMYYAGHTFLGWNTRADGTGTPYSENSWFTAAGDATLYAQWIENYTVTYDRNGASGEPPASQSVIPDSAVILPGPGGLYRAGYAFTGWNTLADGSGTPYSENDWFTAVGDITLYAWWQAEDYSISYDLNYGTVATANPGTYTIEDDITFAVPTREGYTFLGWLNTETQEILTGIPRGSTGHKYFYAQWKSGDHLQISLQPVPEDPPLSNVSIFVDDSSTFSAAGTTFSSWTWYWNGEAVGGNGSEYYLEANSKSPGIYELAVRVLTGSGKIMSARCRVTIKAR
jgi:uncharacterized repeat protein (TIGR02543 family)